MLSLNCGYLMLMESTFVAVKPSAHPTTGTALNEVNEKLVISAAFSQLKNTTKVNMRLLLSVISTQVALGVVIKKFSSSISIPVVDDVIKGVTPVYEIRGKQLPTNL